MSRPTPTDSDILTQIMQATGTINAGVSYLVQEKTKLETMLKTVSTQLDAERKKTEILQAENEKLKPKDSKK